jgi:hypothetical protein
MLVHIVVDSPHYVGLVLVLVLLFSIQSIGTSIRYVLMFIVNY